MRRLALGVALAGALCGTALAQPVVKIAEGALSGVREDGIASFKNIPFAAPPLGGLRWHPPQAGPRWTGTRAASEFGPVCPQIEYDPVTKALPQSEDCLSLNVWTPKVWTPKPQKGAKLPVMVWIYGGGFTGGGASYPYYNGTELAQHGVVVVSFNYRLGELGFFAHPALSAAGEASGNYGLMDQIAALRWVKSHIAAFGGDAHNVTIFGESAGGISVNALMVSPPARGLFERAISESGLGLLPQPTQAQEEQTGIATAKAWGIEGRDGQALGRLRTLDVADVLAARKGKNLSEAPGPMLDGAYLPGQIAVLFGQGKIADADYLAGSNSNEASLRAALSVTDDELLERAGPRLPELRKLYAADGIEGDHAVANTLFTDFAFAAGAKALALFDAKAGHKAYLYYFGYVPENSRARVKGVAHGREVPFVFGVNGYGRFPALQAQITGGTTAKDRSVIAVMQAYWTNFAKTGDPNGDGHGEPAWPAVKAGAAPTLTAGDDIKAVADFHRARLDAAMAPWSAATKIAIPE